MANIDRILNIHQSFTQEKISALNKEILKAQYMQSAHIVALQKQLDASNAISREILNNQLRELKQKEAQKHYRALAFNINTLLDLIANANAPEVKIFLLNFYTPVIPPHIAECQDNLDEISDKTYCSLLVTKLTAINNSLMQNMAGYIETDFATLLDREVEYHNHRIEAIKAISTIKANTVTPSLKPITKDKHKEKLIKKSTLWIWGISAMFLIVIPVFLVIWIILMVKYSKQQKRKRFTIDAGGTDEIQNNYILENNEPVDTAESQITQIENSIENHPYIQIKSQLSICYPEWVTAMEQSYDLFAKIDPTSKEHYSDFTLLHNIVDYIVKKQSYTALMIRKKCGVSENTAGYNRVVKNLGILEKYGIITKSVGSSYSTIISDKVITENILKYIETDYVSDSKPSVDGLFLDVAKFVVMEQNASTSSIQRKFSLSYNRAGRIVDTLSDHGVITKGDGETPSQVIIQDLDALYRMLP